MLSTDLFSYNPVERMREGRRDRRKEGGKREARKAGSKKGGKDEKKMYSCAAWGMHCNRCTRIN
jgi:hypothetical protein